MFLEEMMDFIIIIDPELRVANCVIMFHIKHKEKCISFNILLDGYFLFYLPFSPSRFCPLL